MFQIPNAGSVNLYQKPINMHWGERKLTQLCRDEMDSIRTRADCSFFITQKETS
jgi:hypothetical protein